MTVKEFKKSKMYREAKGVKYFDMNGVNITYKPQIILNLLNIIGTSHNVDGTINVDVEYIE